MYGDKCMLWMKDPELLRMVCYVIGLNVALRGGEEHHSLRHGSNSQLSVATLSSGNTVLR